MNVVVDSTVPEKILLAAFDLEQQGQSHFSAEALIVACWQKFPRTFGLKGYSDQYPDSNKVLTSIMGEKGLTRRGWLAKMGQKVYTLTREGKQAVRRLQQGEDITPVERTTRLSSDQEKFLLNLIGNPAVEKYQQGLKLELNFSDACRFWGISENLQGEALETRLNRLRSNLADVERLVGPAGVDLKTGRNVTQEDLRLLRQVDEYLAERFGRMINMLRTRGVRN